MKHIKFLKKMSKSVDPNLEAIEEIPKHSFELESLKIRVSDPH